VAQQDAALADAMASAAWTYSWRRIDSACPRTMRACRATARRRRPEHQHEVAAENTTSMMTKKMNGKE
jgi:hypothetical protein